MTEFTNEKLGCKFSLPDPLCLRHVEAYETARNEAILAGAQFSPSINWTGAVAIIEDWECEAIPDLNGLSAADLADVHGAALKVVMWAGGQVVVYVMGELYIPKN